MSAFQLFSICLQINILPARLAFLSEKAIKDYCIVTHPRRPNQRDIEVFYEEAM